MHFVFRPLGDPLLEDLPFLLIACEFAAGGGIRSSASSAKIRRTSSLSSGLPGTIGRSPELAGFFAASSSSSRSFALRPFSSGPWHLKQCRDRIGRTWSLKSTP